MKVKVHQHCPWPALSELRNFLFLWIWLLSASASSLTALGNFLFLMVIMCVSIFLDCTEEFLIPNWKWLLCASASWLHWGIAYSYSVFFPGFYLVGACQYLPWLHFYSLPELVTSCRIHQYWLLRLCPVFGSKWNCLSWAAFAHLIDPNAQSGA